MHSAARPLVGSGNQLPEGVARCRIWKWTLKLLPHACSRALGLKLFEDAFVRDCDIILASWRDSCGGGWTPQWTTVGRKSAGFFGCSSNYNMKHKARRSRPERIVSRLCWSAEMLVLLVAGLHFRYDSRYQINMFGTAFRYGVYSG